MVHFGHRILLGHPIELSSKERFLKDRVVQFRVRVCQFHAMNKQLESFRDFRLARLPFCKRADAGRVVDDKDGTDQRVFDFFFEHFAYDHVGMLARRIEPNLFCQIGDAKRI